MSYIEPPDDEFVNGYFSNNYFRNSY